jgi:hypothetical protein
MRVHSIDNEIGSADIWRSFLRWFVVRLTAYIGAAVFPAAMLLLVAVAYAFLHGPSSNTVARPKPNPDTTQSSIVRGTVIRDTVGTPQPTPPEISTITDALVADNLGIQSSEISNLLSEADSLKQKIRLVSTKAELSINLIRIWNATGDQINLAAALTSKQQTVCRQAQGILLGLIISAKPSPENRFKELIDQCNEKAKSYSESLKSIKFDLDQVKDKVELLESAINQWAHREDNVLASKMAVEVSLETGATNIARKLATLR